MGGLARRSEGMAIAGHWRGLMDRSRLLMRLGRGRLVAAVSASFAENDEDITVDRGTA